MKLYRQGDVLLVPINPVEVPDWFAAPVKREAGKLILAHGEATGHHHAILDRDAELVGIAVNGEEFITADEAVELYLLVHAGDPVELVHQEHSTITVDPGTYRVVRQREYTPLTPVRVLD